MSRWTRSSRCWPTPIRLRATWLAECAALIGLPAFLQAAGISCCQRLGDITATLDAGGEEQAIALLGGSSR